MRLKSKKYNYKEIKEFERKTTAKNLNYLLDNVSCMRILGWTITIPEEYKFNTGGFGDVIKFTSSPKFILHKGRKVNER